VARAGTSLVMNDNFKQLGIEEEQKLICMDSLKEGDLFDADIKRIMNIIGNVEK
jgi:hypothetical protein